MWNIDDMSTLKPNEIDVTQTLIASKLSWLNLNTLSKIIAIKDYIRQKLFKHYTECLTMIDNTYYIHTSIVNYNDNNELSATTSELSSSRSYITNAMTNIAIYKERFIFFGSLF